MDDALEREIEQIENDHSLSQREKIQEIEEIERDYRSQARESAQRAYDDEMNNW